MREPPWQFLSHDSMYTSSSFSASHATPPTGITQGIIKILNLYVKNIIEVLTGTVTDLLR